MQLLLAAAESPDTTSVTAFFSFVTANWEFCVMQFLEFAIWGAWFVVLGNLLNARGFTRTQIGRVYACMPIGSMVTPLFIGTVADNYVNAEVLVGVCHLLGFVLLFMMAKAKNPTPFYFLTLLYALVFSPTLTLTSSIIFADDSAAGGFAWIRVFGTIGWIVAGLSHAVILKKDQPVNENPLILASVLSLALGIFSLTVLPETKPGAVLAYESAVQTLVDDGMSQEEAEAQATTDLANSESPDTFQATLGMLTGNPVFFGVTFVAAMAMGLYFAFAALFVEKTGVPSRIVGPVMTIGQVIEIFFMLALPYFLGPNYEYMNWVLLIGISAWALRFALFAIGRPIALVLAGVAIHGICFDFFFGAGFYNADLVAPEGLTNTAQAFYGFLVYGLGMFLGSEAAGWLNQRFSQPVESTTDAASETAAVEARTNWTGFWGIPCAVVAACTVLFALSADLNVAETTVEDATEEVSEMASEAAAN